MARVLRGRSGQYNGRGALARSIEPSTPSLTLHDIYVPKMQAVPVQVFGAGASSCSFFVLWGCLSLRQTRSRTQSSLKIKRRSWVSLHLSFN